MKEREREPCGERHPGPRSGFVLPLAIVLLPAFLALSFSAFVLARSQLALLTMDDRLVEELAAAHPPVTLVPAPGEEVVPLEAGYLLLQAAPGPMADGRRGHRVAWRVDPELLAGSWTQVPDGPPDLGPIPLSRILWATRPEESGGGGGHEGEWHLPSGHRIQGEGAVLLASEDQGVVVLLAPGSVEVAGEGPLPAVLMAGGDVVLTGQVVLVGAVRAHGLVRVQEYARVVPDSAVVHAGLSHPFLAGPHLLPGGERLGRH